jgi:hypothetical protein
MPDSLVELYLKRVKCKKMTAREPGETDEIRFDVSGGQPTNNPEFDIREGQELEKNDRLWSHPVQETGELIFSIHLIESDNFFNVRGGDPQQDVGYAQLRVYRNGSQYSAKFHPAGSSNTALIGQNAIRFGGAGAEYDAIFHIVVAGEGRIIPIEL